MNATTSRFVALAGVALGAAILSPAVGAGAGEARVVRPEIILPAEGAIQNAGMGTEIWQGGPADGVTNLVKYAVRVSDHSVNSMIRPNWSDYESEEGKYLFEKMDRHFQYCIEYGQKLNIGGFVTSANHGNTIDGALCAYPAYVHEALQRSGQKDVRHTASRGTITRWEPNFENPYFFERYEALLKAFAEYLEQPLEFKGKRIQRRRLVRCIEMRHFGFWGEGAYPKHLVPSNSECMIRFAEAFARHFPGIRLVVPTNGMVHIPSIYDTLKDYHFHLLEMTNSAGLCGIFRDNWGWDERSGYFQRIYYASNRYEKAGVRMYELIRDRWKVAPLIGEPGRTYPKGDFRPYSCLPEQAAYLHPSLIRNCNVSSGTEADNPGRYSILDDPQALDAFHRTYGMIGFRVLYTSARVSRPEGGLEIALDWLNIGLAPTYDEWTLRYSIEDAGGREVWSGDSTFDLRRLHPAEGIPPGLVDRGKITSHVDRFANVPARGRLFLQIVDPVGVSPPMALSIRGRTAAGAYLLVDEGGREGGRN